MSIYMGATPEGGGPGAAVATAPKPPAEPSTPARVEKPPDRADGEAPVVSTGDGVKPTPGTQSPGELPPQSPSAPGSTQPKAPEASGEQQPRVDTSPRGQAVSAITEGQRLVPGVQGTPESVLDGEGLGQLVQGLEEVAKDGSNPERQRQAQEALTRLGPFVEVVGKDGVPVSYTYYKELQRTANKNGDPGQIDAKGELDLMGDRITFRPVEKTRSSASQSKPSETQGQERTRGKRRKDHDESKRREDLNTKIDAAQNALNETASQISTLEETVMTLNEDLERIMHMPEDKRPPGWENIRAQIAAAQDRIAKLNEKHKEQNAALLELQARQAVYTELDRLRNQLRSGEIRGREARRQARQTIKLLEMAAYASDSSTGRALVQLALRSSQGIPTKGSGSNLSQPLKDYLSNPENKVSADAVQRELRIVMGDAITPEQATEFASALTSDNPAALGKILRKYPRIATDKNFSKALLGEDNEKAYKDHVLDKYPIRARLYRSIVRKGGLTTIGFFAFLTYGLFIQPGMESGFEPASAGQQ